MTKGLPHRLIPIENADKTWHESVKKLDTNLANFAHPFRLCACGPPNSGKTTMFQNLLLHQKNPFQKVTVFHCDSETKEWSSVCDSVVTECPRIEDFDPDVKNLCIIDDIALKSLGKDERMRLDRLCGSWSTHRNISIMISAQQPNQIPASIRRMMSIYCLWKSVDLMSLRDLATKCGVAHNDLTALMSLLEKPTDSLCIDLTSKYKYRRNIFELIEEA